MNYKDKWVNKMLLSLEMEEVIDKELLHYLKPRFEQMFVAGMEYGFREFCELHDNHTTLCRPKFVNTKFKLGQFDKEGNQINLFESQRDATRKTGFTRKVLVRSIRKNVPCQQGWIWRYVPVEVKEDAF